MVRRASAGSVAARDECSSRRRAGGLVEHRVAARRRGDRPAPGRARRTSRWPAGGSTCWWTSVARGATGAGLALPAEGDPLGLGGPARLQRAGDGGRAPPWCFAGAGAGLVPDDLGGRMTFRRVAAQRRQVPDLGEADRGLRLALTTTAAALADLDVARWRPEVADELMDLRRPAPSSPRRRGSRRWRGPLAARALRASTIVALGARRRRRDHVGVRDREPAGRAASPRPGGASGPGRRLLGGGLASRLSRR